MIEAILLFARAGGGGSGGGGGGAGIIVLPVIIISAVVAWWRRKQQIKKAKKDLLVAQTNDPQWSGIRERASDVFNSFQQDWSDSNVESMKQYLTPRYHQHISLMMEALGQMNRTNRVSNIRLESTTIMRVSDSAIDTNDNFDAEMIASAHDELIASNTGDVLFVDDKGFTEIWNFDREEDQWLLDKISQTGIDSYIEAGFTSKSIGKTKVDTGAQMRTLAQNNGFFYNADFGWLLMPTRGQLFILANFGRSDINYHVLGKYHGVLVQLYQYIPIIEDKRKFADYFKAIYKPAYRHDAYVVVQTILPRSYGNIIVKKKGGLGLTSRPSGMTRVSLEGIQFDKQYSVYATDLERATSLELLHPKFMELLLMIKFTVNIEIVDNVLYLYSIDKNADFDIMLSLMQNAFEEMKM